MKKHLKTFKTKTNMASLASHTVTVSRAASDIGGSVEQQDTGFTAILKSSTGRSATIAAVFDGHGRARGAVMSRMTSIIFQRELGQETWLDKFLMAPEVVGRALFEKASEKAFQLNQELLRSRNISFSIENGHIITEREDLIQGGSTATLVIVMDDATVHCFNVGDSDAWLSTPNGCQPLHTNHAPDNEAEYHRIMAVCPNSKIEYDYSNICGMPRRSDGDYVFPRRPDFRGYYSKNVRGDLATTLRVKTFCLTMTRSIGDEPLRSGGVSAEPSYKCVSAKGPAVIRVASDGFWDNLIKDDIAFVPGHMNANVLNKRWFRETEAKARKFFGRSRDNMWGYTIVIQ